MKKIFTVLFTALMAVGISVGAHAQDDLVVEVTMAGSAQAEAVMTEPSAAFEPSYDPALYDDLPIPMDEPQLSPPLADGAAGRGTIKDIAAYWAKNGWPENISFAYLADGESLPYNPDTDAFPPAPVSWWEVGVVDADEAARQEILALVSPDCRVTFRDCAWSYKRREAAFNEIYAMRGDIVRDALMSANTESVLVEIAEGYEKEYAKKFIEQYGAFILVTNDVHMVDYVDSIGGAILVPEMGRGLDMGAGESVTTGGSPKSPLRPWFWAACLALFAGAAVLVYFNRARSRARLVPALQTANGDVVTGGARASRKQCAEAVKNSALTPREDVFSSIMERVGDAQK